MAGLRAAAFAAGALLVVSFATGLRQPGWAADERPLSPAQIALFETDHLVAIGGPARLDYTFRQEGPNAYDDKISLSVTKVHPDRSKDLSIAFLSGPRRVEFPPVTDFHGNPLIMYFLEWDVLGMHRATGGSALYFRNRVREAFVDEAEIGQERIALDGHLQPATVIGLRPYLHDPSIGQYARFRDKAYRFVLSRAVPGMIYEISASVPRTGTGAPVISDRVTYLGIRQ